MMSFGNRRTDEARVSSIRKEPGAYGKPGYFIAELVVREHVCFRKVISLDIAAFLEVGERISLVDLGDGCLIPTLEELREERAVRKRIEALKKRLVS